MEGMDEKGSSTSNLCKIKDEYKVSSGGNTKPIKIVSWNINGMRTLDMPSVLKQLSCSILSVQETKLTRKQLDQSQIIPEGYSSYFSFSSNRIGYSGVATFCKDDWFPQKAEEGLSYVGNGERASPVEDDLVGCYPDITEEEESHVKFANADGRTVLTQHLVMTPDGSKRPLTVINVYCPRLRDDPEDPTNNSEFKMTFHDVIHRRAKELLKAGSFVVLLGDINISHRWLDHCEADEKTFLVTEFRQLLNQFLDDKDPLGFVDTYRSLHPHQTGAYTCWNTRLNARENNYGTRIDYIFVDKELAKYVKTAEIHPEVVGSDHCPISVTLHSLHCVSHVAPPSFATKYYPEFKGKQRSLRELLLAPKSVSSSVASSVSDSSVSVNDKQPNNGNGRKRPLENDVPGKLPPNKRKQTTLASFFTKDKKDTSSGTDDTSQDTPECKNEILGYLEQPESHWQERSEQKRQNSEAWKLLMKAPEVPLCSGHNEPCARRTVKKKGANFGREFWSCSHGVGKKDDPNANCNFFKWVKSGTGSKS